MDTNIFFDNWFLNSPQFKLLGNFCNNTGIKVLLPQIVRQEVENKYKISVQHLETQAAELSRKISGLTPERIIDFLPPSPNDYDLVSILKKTFNLIEVIPYDKVEHAKLVEKTLNNKRPFNEKEKGYRDALLWLSTLSFLKPKNNKFNVFFINNNYSDFFKKTETSWSLHPDLIEDIEHYEIQNTIIPYVSVKDFTSDKVPAELHNFDHDEFSEIYGAQFEIKAIDEAMSFLSQMPVSELKNVFENSVSPSSTLPNFEDVTFTNYDGLSDPIMYGFSTIEDNKLFIHYAFKMPGIDTVLNLEVSDYFSRKYDVERTFHSVDFTEGKIQVSSYDKTNFEASVIFDRTTKTIESLSIDSMEFRSRH